MKSRGFLLIDSLITVFIVSVLAMLCLDVFNSISNYKEGYENYKNEINEYYNELYDSLGECEKCVIIQEDSSVLEP